MMMNQAFQKQGEPASAGRGRLRAVLCSLVCLLVMAAVLVCVALAGAVEAGEETASTASDAKVEDEEPALCKGYKSLVDVKVKKASIFPCKDSKQFKDPKPLTSVELQMWKDAQFIPCKNLKPFTDMDDLLYQIYMNLDSDCLFKTNPEELAKIWGIPSIVYINTAYIPNWFIGQRRKQTKGDHDHLVLEVVEMDDDPFHDVFAIRLYDRYIDARLYPSTEFPKTLPAPLIYEKSVIHDNFSKPGPGRDSLMCARGQFVGDKAYNWYNKDTTKWMELDTQCGIVYSINVRDFVLPRVLENSYKCDDR